MYLTEYYSSSISIVYDEFGLKDNGFNLKKKQKNTDYI